MAYPKRTECKNGHPYIEGSYRIASDGSRVCKQCMRDTMRMRRTGTTDNHQRARGTGTVTKLGYIAIAKDKKKEQAHRLIVEQILGIKLPPSVEIHHVNGNRQDNRPENLVVCPDRAYHRLLHVRSDAMEACGNPEYRKCPFCKEYSDPSTMKHNASSRYFFHAACAAQNARNRRSA